MSKPDFRIQIYCPVIGNGHRRKGVTITVFRYIGDGRWEESVRGPWRRSWLTPGDSNVPDSGITLAGDDPSSSSRVIEDGPGSEYAKSLRSLYSIACPVCAPERTPVYNYTGEIRTQGANVTVTQETLFNALNETRRVGATRLSLAALDAIVQRMAQDSV